MKPGDIAALVAYRLEQADDSLRMGTLGIEKGLYKDAINRFYYAMFYATQALLVPKGKGSSKLQGVIELFDLEFIRTGELSKEMSKSLHDSFERRMNVDYKEFVKVSLSDAESMQARAEKFLEQAKAALADLLNHP